MGAWCARALQTAGIAVDSPEGAFYLFPDFEPLRSKLEERGIRTAEHLCHRLLEDIGVAVLPGTDFGRPHGELTIRMAYVDFDGTKAIARATDKPDEAWLRAHCERVVDGIERICTWLM